MPKGKLIVIDGTDGSGKATQTKLLVDRLNRENHPTAMISFPQYGTKSAGPLEEYLAGKYGSANEVGPYRASILYAVDRYDASARIGNDLGNGKIVVADRYVLSNMGHQGGKIASEQERRKFYAWEDELEHELFHIPRPDLNIMLHVPAEIGQKLIQARDIKQDLHQQDLEHLKQAEKTYLELAKIFSNVTLIECVENDKLLPIDLIHEKIWKIVQPHIFPS